MRLQSTRFTGATVFAIIATIAPQMGCSSKSDSIPAPFITVFYPSTSTIMVGGTTNLIAMFKGGDGVITDAAGNVIVSSVVSLKTYEVAPTETTVYTLTVKNSEGVTSTWDTTVTVVPLPVITSFSAAPATLTYGETTTFSAVFDADCTGVITDSLGTEMGTISTGGTLVVTPSHAGTLVYTLTITSTLGGVATKDFTVTVKGAGIDYTEECDTLAGCTVVAANLSGWCSQDALDYIKKSSVEPKASTDGTSATSYFNWPYILEDTVEYDFDSSVSVQYSSVYWWADAATYDGGTAAPSAYKVQYLDSDGVTWTDVANPYSANLVSGAWTVDTANAAYYIAYETYNTVGFDIATSKSFRLLMEPRDQTASYALSLGIQRWKLYGGYAN